jgi:hypothetical protein
MITILFLSAGNELSLLIQKPIPKRTKGDQIFRAIQKRYLYPFGIETKNTKGIKSIITGTVQRK